jgi:phosphatidylinositol glycan class Z
MSRTQFARVQVQKLAAVLGRNFIVHGWMLFVVSRLWMACLSMLLDFSLFILLQRMNTTDAFRHMVNFASSWPVLVLCVRPFSNTLEAVAVALVLALVSSKGRCSAMTCYAVVMCAVAGVWIRVTTIAFLAPAAVFLIARLLKAREISLLVQSIVAIFIAASALVLVDSRFYGGTKSIVTPLNLFVYNSNTTNLANHGLHPRITHAAVNMPMLLTAGLPLLFCKVFSTAASLSGGRLSWLHMDTLLAATVFVGITALSLFPHQEPRFLLPLLVPSFALLSTVPRASCIRMRSVWAVLNAALLIFWGGFHQGALLPALFSLSSGSSACAIAVAGTYSAPTAAVAKCAAIGQCSSVPVVSLEGASVPAIDSYVQTSLSHQCVFLVAPYSHPLYVSAPLLSAPRLSTRLFTVGLPPPCSAARASSLLYSGGPTFLQSTFVILSSHLFKQPLAVIFFSSCRFLPNMRDKLPVLKIVKCAQK